MFEGADRVKLFVVGRNPGVAVLLWNRYYRAGVRSGRLLDEAIGQLLVEYGVGLFGNDGVDAVKTGSDGCTIQRNGTLERDDGAVAKVGFGCRQKVRVRSKRARTSGVCPLSYPLKSKDSHK